MPSLKPYRDKNFGGSLVFDFGQWLRHVKTIYSLPRSRFLDVTQRSPKKKTLRDIQKTAARETTTQTDLTDLDLIPQKEIQKKQLKSTKAYIVNGKSTVVSMGFQSSVQTTDKLLKCKQQSNSPFVYQPLKFHI